PPDAEDIMPHASQYLRRPAGRERYGRLAIGPTKCRPSRWCWTSSGAEISVRSRAIFDLRRLANRCAFEPALISGPSSLFGANLLPVSRKMFPVPMRSEFG